MCLVCPYKAKLYPKSWTFSYKAAGEENTAYILETRDVEVSNGEFLIKLLNEYRRCFVPVRRARADRRVMPALE